MEKTNRVTYARIRNIFRLHWMLLAVFIYSAALAAGNLLILQPQLQKYEYNKKIRSELAETYLKIRSIDLQATHDFLKNESNSVGELEKTFASRCIETKDLQRVISDLSRQAREAGVQLLFLDFLPEQEIVRERFLKKPITMRFLGTYDQILSFYYRLEQIPYWLLVDSFVITSPKGPTASLNISLVLYTIMPKV